MITHRRRTGRGVLNKLINKLPVELHIPGGYQYCGPGTKLAKRLARGDPGINPLDSACKEHDIAYSENREDVVARNVADKVLANKAWQRVNDPSASVGEKIAAFSVSKAMKLKSKLGMGIKRRRKTSKKSRKKSRKSKRSIRKRSLKSITKHASKGMKFPGHNARQVIGGALKFARSAVKEAGGRKKVSIPRILPVSSKEGGFLPYLVPLFAGLSATGALAGGAAGIAKAVNDTKAAERQLEESRRHNRAMEGRNVGKLVCMVYTLNHTDKGTVYT